MRIVKVAKDGTITLSDFNSIQAYKIAIKLEKDGIEFYRELAQEVKDQDARREIDFLIEQEKEHQATFEDLLNKEKKSTEDAFEEDDVVNYLNSHVFDISQGKAKAENMAHRHTAMEEAMNMERRSIVFYEGCLSHTKDPQAKSALEKILGEEKKHLSKFAELLRIKCINSQKGCLL